MQPQDQATDGLHVVSSPGDRLQSGDPLLGDVGADGLQGPNGRLCPCSCANLGGQ